LLRGFYAHPSGVLRELPKDSGRFPEGFPKKTIKKQETDINNIYFTEALYTLCNFTFLQPHFCHVNRVSGIGDDWLRKIIFSIILVKLAWTSVDEFYFLKIKNPNYGNN
jgi:hypothetical protein